MLIDMEEAHLAHDRERRRRKIDEETNEEREERLALEGEARRALARKKYSLIAKETPNQIAARLSQRSQNDPKTIWIQVAQHNHERIDWLHNEVSPVDEFHTPGYIARAFPTFYPWRVTDLNERNKTDGIL
ncbi:hypothetical protein RhiirA5_507837 [Rhizophagus irregularis]|uniref:Uncharacterized protein n=1 Tax=Rhizophagus irregularis TaxID=588596 RepID=A0A2N0NGT6_9GLOM|nr:hypothetical protein RhiirA5_507837 [Rhizophagus irregularis]